MLQQLKQPTVKAAIVALQNGDVKGWNRLFEPDATLLDDGQPRDLKRFSSEALGHERFLSIDKVSSDGLSIEGEFQSDKWGRFRTYFRFTISSEGAIVKLEIGQVRPCFRGWNVTITQKGSFKMCAGFAAVVRGRGR